MPIRMVDDPQQPRKKPSSGKTGGIPPILLLFLPKLLKLFAKKTKLLLLLVVAAGAYFFLFRDGGNVAPSESETSLSTGLEMDPEVYDRSEIYEPLSTDYKNQLPARVSLEQYCPDRLNQGSQGSCVGWSSAYAARTIQQA